MRNRVGLSHIGDLHLVLQTSTHLPLHLSFILLSPWNYFWLDRWRGSSVASWDFSVSPVLGLIGDWDLGLALILTDGYQVLPGVTRCKTTFIGIALILYKPRLARCGPRSGYHVAVSERGWNVTNVHWAWLIIRDSPGQVTSHRHFLQISETTLATLNFTEQRNLYMCICMKNLVYWQAQVKVRIPSHGMA